MTEETNGLLTRISNDVAALIDMVGDLQKQTAGESLTNQMKFRRDKYAYTQPLRFDRGAGKQAKAAG